jgi:hypothetical protein
MNHFAISIGWVPAHPFNAATIKIIKGTPASAAKIFGLYLTIAPCLLKK